MISEGEINLKARSMVANDVEGKTSVDWKLCEHQNKLCMISGDTVEAD